MVKALLSIFALFLSARSALGFTFLPQTSRPLVTASLTALQMSAVAEVKVGDKLPAVTLMEGQADYGTPAQVNLLDLVKGKKVAIFAVPGAFTPGCSKSHLPSFITAMDDLKAKGVEMVICVATNDAYVMEVRKQRSFFS